MPRPLRIEYEGAWYHVMNRGANRQKIFFKNTHREIFIRLLEEISIRFNAEIHAYCLMSNHYHLLIRTIYANLSRIMRHLDGLYTQYFNRDEKRDGPLFRGRYKAILVESDTYLLQLSRYIHLNPAEIGKNPFTFRWSSLQFYLQEKTKNSWLCRRVVLEYMSNENPNLNYMEYIKEGVSAEIKEFYSREKLSSILGRKNFINEHLKKIKEQNITPFSPDIRRCQKSNSSIDAICEITCSHFNIDSATLMKKTPGKVNLAKLIVIFVLSQIEQMPHSKIGKYFNLSNESVGASLRNGRILLQNNIEFKKNLDSIVKKSFKS